MAKAARKRAAGPKKPAAAAPGKPAPAAATPVSLRDRLAGLYHGRTRRAIGFQYGLLAFDAVTIGFFVISSMFEPTPVVLAAEYAIAIVLLVDFTVRLWIAKSKSGFLFQITTAADLIVIATLLLPALVENFAFLRVARALRLLRSYHLLADLRKRNRFFKRNEEIIQSVVNLTVFIFVVTALVYVFQVRVNPSITNYVDALYFTVTTLTTTGFGDIVLKGSSGRLLSVIIMVAGVALFLRLIQTIFRPHKARYRCRQCGLKRHDPDAVHCKHCGAVVHIEAEGY